jgi:hypothetical protein
LSIISVIGANAIIVGVHVISHFIAMWTGFSKTRRQFHLTRFVTFTYIAMSRTEQSFTITEFLSLVWMDPEMVHMF